MGLNRIAQRVVDQVSTGDITDVVAGSGLEGGGSTGAVTLTLDASNLTALGTTVATTDYVVIYDTDGTATKKVLVSNMPGLWA
tara:strand:+ start:436 stop:684 length:249 start_codon:yes stop_codon:yes gene_type:complete